MKITEAEVIAVLEYLRDETKLLSAYSHPLRKAHAKAFGRITTDIKALLDDMRDGIPKGGLSALEQITCDKRFHRTIAEHFK